LARDDVDVDARFAVVQVLAGARALGGAFLGDAVLLGGEPGDGFGALAIGAHGGAPYGVPPIWGRGGAFESGRREPAPVPAGAASVRPRGHSGRQVRVAQPVAQAAEAAAIVRRRQS